MEGLIEQHCDAWQTSSHNRHLFSLLWVLLNSVVRDEVLNQEKEVERHRQREGYWESECITQVLKDDVSDQAQLCCDDLVFEPLILWAERVWKSVQPYRSVYECQKEKKKETTVCWKAPTQQAIGPLERATGVNEMTVQPELTSTLYWTHIHFTTPVFFHLNSSIPPMTCQGRKSTGVNT